jgi:catecholate siderophore receptor
MRYIQSRKHAAARQPRHRTTVALAAAAFALPGAVLAQAAAAPAAAASQARSETTLPTVKVQAAQDNDYKADVVSSPKFT